MDTSPRGVRPTITKQKTDVLVSGDSNYVPVPSRLRATRTSSPYRRSQALQQDEEDDGGPCAGDETLLQSETVDSVGQNTFEVYLASLPPSQVGDDVFSGGRSACKEA